jgi:hypothetical protein
MAVRDMAAREAILHLQAIHHTIPDTPMPAMRRSRTIRPLNMNPNLNLEAPLAIQFRIIHPFKLKCSVRGKIRNAHQA